MFTVLTDIGRSAIAELVAGQSLYMAFGPGLAHWDTTKEVLGTFNALDNTLDVGYTEIDQIIVAPPTPGEPVLFYEEGVDYIVSKATGILMKIPGGSIGNSQVRVTFYVKPASPNRTQTSMVSILSLKEIISKQFVVADPEGDIVVQGGGRYSISEDPTTLLFISCTLLEPELPTAVLKQIGIFIDPVFQTEPAPGQVLFPADSFSSFGKLLTLRNYPAVVRNEAARETFQYVIPF